MEVKAILLVPAPGSGVEFAGCPLPVLDLLGKSLVERTAERMLAGGIEGVTILCDGSILDMPWFRKHRQSGDSSITWERTSGEDLWRSAAAAFTGLVSAGAELILLQRVDLYAEINYRKLVQAHLMQHPRVTSVCDDSGQLGIFCVNASRRNDATKICRNRLQGAPVEHAEYRFSGYLNRLRDMHDFRELTRHALFQRNELVPDGRQIRPGVWVGENSRIERGARIVAPAYLGARSRIRAAAVITRGSVVERYAQVDCGTVIEDGTVLPFCYVGAGLEVNHSVVGFNRLCHLRRRVEVEIPDPRLLNMQAQRPAHRAATALLSLTTFLPQAIARSVLGSKRQPAQQPAGEPAFASTLSGWETPVPGTVPQPAESDFPDRADPNLMPVTRRHGDQ